MAPPRPSGSHWPSTHEFLTGFSSDRVRDLDFYFIDFSFLFKKYQMLIVKNLDNT